MTVPTFATRIVILFACALTVTSAVFWLRLTAEDSFSSASPLDVPHQVSSNEFVTSNACRSCHPDQYSTWHDSFHRTMTQIATPEAVVAPFEDLELRDDALSCRLERRGNEYWATVFETNWKERYLAAGIDPETVIGTSRTPFLTKRVELTTGSHHVQIFWISDKSNMVELPFYYHIDGKRWIPRSDSVLVPPASADAGVSTSEWRMECIKCHSVGGNPGLTEYHGRAFLQSSVAEFGISCEACHGPAKQHIEHHRNPLNRYRRHLDGEPDPTIVNPKRLSHIKSSEICGQCHLSFVPKDPDFLTRGLQYRAGDDLTVTHEVQLFEDGPLREGGFMTYWRDGTVCVGGDEYLGLIKSACYLRGEMSCLSCHSMHQSDPNDQLAEGMDSNQACLQCHKSFIDNIEEHTHHPVNSSGSRCYNCHMPNTSYALFTAMRSHRIDSPDIASSHRSGRPNACNLCHLDQTLDWSAQHLTQWYGAPAVELDEDEETVAASLLWLLRGNAAQRVIIVWHMGWEPAHRAAGKTWQAPFLAQILEDPYSVVRYIAHQSLTKLPGYEDFTYDFIGPEQERSRAHREALTKWEQQNRDLGSRARRLLLDPTGHTRDDDVSRFLQQRDDTPIVITE